jgi:hypothetical protein
MRGRADATAIRSFLRELGRLAREPATIYLVGGATAVVEGWRATTVGIDLRDVRAKSLLEVREPAQDDVAPRLFRFPAIDVDGLRAAVERATA